MPRQACPRRGRAGWAPTGGRWSISDVFPGCWSRIISRAASAKPASTSRSSTYADMAEHYGCAVLPARPRKPRDKAKVENGVLIAQRWILAVLRPRTFYSLAALNTAIRECLERLNTHPLKKAKKSRRELFEALDPPNALPLPPRSYEHPK